MFISFNNENIAKFNKLLRIHNNNQIDCFITKRMYLCLLLNEKSFSGCSVARSSRLVWDEEVAGSNPATPTKKKKP